MLSYGDIIQCFLNPGFRTSNMEMSKGFLMGFNPHLSHLRSMIWEEDWYKVKDKSDAFMRWNNRPKTVVVQDT